MAGLGTRLRPHTWSKPKQLISVAGKTVLDHVLAILNTLQDHKNVELICIVGYLGDQIETHVREHFPDLKSHFVVQENPRGQSHAISLAREFLDGPMLMIFADTLIETDLSCLISNHAESIAWVKEVEDPRRFGVAITGTDGCVRQLVEKPTDRNNNLAVVGFYYFRDSQALLSAIDEQMQRDLQLKGEFFLVDAINLMLNQGLKMQVCPVNVWLDAGTPEALLETNRYLLNHGLDNSQEAAARPGLVVQPPVYIHPSAQVTNSIIGPNVSLGACCKVEQSIIEESILEEEARVTQIILKNSLVGRRARISRSGASINAGDNTEVSL